MKRWTKTAAAILLTVTLAGAGAAARSGSFSLPETAVTAQAADGTVTFDSATGTLTLSGTIAYADLNAYRGDASVKKVAAAAGTKFANAGGLFYNILAESMDLSKADTSGMTTMTNMFYGCNNLKTLNLSGFDTSNVTNMYMMFADCYSLTSLDLSGFDTSKVTTMYAMFSGCQSLTSLNLSGLNTANVQIMDNMFYACTSLTSLNLSSFNTANAVTMKNMFTHCSSLAALDLSGFNTSKVTNMAKMFRECESLTSLDLRNFDTSNVSTMEQMFYCCGGLKSLNVGSFDTSNVENMSYMFAQCYVLESLDLSSFDTSNVKSMDTMFEYCSALTELDLGSFDTANVETMDYMFSYCSSMKTIYVSDKWNLKNLGSSFNMFGNCNCIVGGNGTTYDASNLNQWYAHIDAEGDPGYLTEKQKAALSSVTLSKTQFNYTGSAVKVGSYLTAYAGDKKLVYGTDFTMSYANNVKVGYQTASVTITGIGDYTGTITKKYSIVPAQQAAPALSVNDGVLHVAWTADSNALAYQVAYCRNSSFSSSDSTYHIVTYTGKTACDLTKYPQLGETWYVKVRAVITDDGTTSGTKYGTWSTASNIKLTRAIDTVTLSQTQFNYTGSAVKVGNYLKVYSGSTLLTYGTDFTMTYANNVQCGINTASVTVKGVGSYTGTIKKTYTIVPAQQAKPTLTAVSGGFKASWKADSNAVAYQLVYCKNSSFSSSDASYHTVTYTGTSTTLTKYPAAGETWYVKVRAVITSDGTTSGTKYGTWSSVSSIYVADKLITSVTLSKTQFEYTGSAVKVGSYLKVYSGSTLLTYGTDFTMTYANNVKCGVNTASVTVTGTGNYAGIIKTTYTIVPVQQAKPTLTAVSDGFKASWTADSNAVAYQLVYCKNSSFSSSDASYHLATYTGTSATLTKYPAAGETWYVKVRAVVTSDGTTSGTKYGTWSTVASITVK